jgi:hypothetical protein
VLAHRPLGEFAEDADQREPEQAEEERGEDHAADHEQRPDPEGERGDCK